MSSKLITHTRSRLTLTVILGFLLVLRSGMALAFLPVPPKAESSRLVMSASAPAVKLEAVVTVLEEILDTHFDSVRTLPPKDLTDALPGARPKARQAFGCPRDAYTVTARDGSRLARGCVWTSQSKARIEVTFSTAGIDQWTNVVCGLTDIQPTEAERIKAALTARLNEKGWWTQ
jgi:hypothetical protein